MTQHSHPAVKLALPRQFREIRLELAREPGHPAGKPGAWLSLNRPAGCEGPHRCSFVGTPSRGMPCRALPTWR